MINSKVQLQVISHVINDMQLHASVAWGTLVVEQAVHMCALVNNQHQQQVCTKSSSSSVFTDSAGTSKSDVHSVQEGDVNTERMLNPEASSASEKLTLRHCTSTTSLLRVVGLLSNNNNYFRK